jgi:hypothetical protein
MNEISVLANIKPYINALYWKIVLTPAKQLCRATLSPFYGSSVDAMTWPAHIDPLRQLEYQI